MHPQRLAGRRAPARGVIAAAMLLSVAGCKSDLNQQLLERELRYQEDQIYQLQDELAEKCARLEHVGGENTSLRRQLGVSDGDQAAPSRGRRTRGPAVPPAATVPPAIEIPEAGSAPRGGAAPRGGGPPTELAPPMLEGVPPLPAEPAGPPRTEAGEGLSLPPATASIDPAARPIESAVHDPAEADAPALVRLSHAEPDAGGDAVRLAVNPAGSTLLDADGDGRSDGLTLVIEPRDSAERLASVGGDVTITAFDAAAAPGDPPLARWTVAAADAAARFRPTGRLRGLVLELPWQAARPAGGHVRVTVRVAGAEAVETEAIVPAR